MAPIEIPPGLWHQLRADYARPPRHYHTFEHVLEVTGHYADVARDVGWSRGREVFVAILFHDVIYECGASDNERRSAEYARRAIRTWLSGCSIDVDHVAHLIELTARHGDVDPGRLTADEAHFLDCDMAILGADRERYMRYEDAVRAECTEVIPADRYRAGRRRFLTHLLSRDAIYLTEYFRARLEARARENIAAALARS